MQEKLTSTEYEILEACLDNDNNRNPTFTMFEDTNIDVSSNLDFTLFLNLI